MHYDKNFCHGDGGNLTSSRLAWPHPIRARWHVGDANGMDMFMTAISLETSFNAKGVRAFSHAYAFTSEWCSRRWVATAFLDSNRLSPFRRPSGEGKKAHGHCVFAYFGQCFWRYVSGQEGLWPVTDFPQPQPWRDIVPSVVSTHSRDFLQNLFLQIDGVIPATRGRVRSP